MKFYNLIVPAIVWFFINVSLSAVELKGTGSASEKKSDKTETVYIFGVGSSFNDSTVYVSSICELSDITLEKKTKFLPYRAEFSLQLKQYLEGNLGNLHQTCTVFFSTNQKKLLKRYNKVKQHYLDSENKKLQILGKSEFNFKNPMASIPEK